MAVLTCGAGGSTASEVITQINTNTTDIATIETTLTNVTSGTYTSTATAGTNVASTTGGVVNYTRVGNIVTFSGTVNVTCTATATFSTVTIDIPIASNFTIAGDCVGSISSTSSGLRGVLGASYSSDAISISFYPGSTSAFDIVFSGTYQIK